MKTLKIIGLISVLAQLILSVVAASLIISLNVLPDFYVFLVVFVFSLLFLISAIFVISRSPFRVGIAPSW